MCHNGDMLSDGVFLWLTVFVATVVELVEALTIVLALGVTRGWKSAIAGTLAALACLVVVILVFIRTFAAIEDESMIPIRPLWTIVGTLLLIFGLQWMKKAILRIGGALASRDEDEIYGQLTTDAKRTKRSKAPIDWYSFTMVFKGVLLEGFEVVFIVVIFGSAHGDITTGFTAAAAATLFTVVLGLLIHKPLSKVPENWMKLTVGLLLVVFGTYFGGEGAGIIWPLGEWALLYLLISYAAFSWFMIEMERVSNMVLGVKR